MPGLMNCRFIPRSPPTAAKSAGPWKISEQDILVPFSVSSEELSAGQNAGADSGSSAGSPVLPPDAGRAGAKRLIRWSAALNALTVDDGVGPINPEWKSKPIDAPPAKVAFAILTPDETPVIPSNQLPNAGQVDVPPAGSAEPIHIALTADQIKTLITLGRFYVEISPTTIASQYGMEMPVRAEDSPVVLAVPDPSNVQKLHFIAPAIGGK